MVVHPEKKPALSQGSHGWPLLERYLQSYPQPFTLLSVPNRGCTMYSLGEVVGTKEVAQIIRERREVLRAELQKLDEVLVHYGDRSVVRAVSKEPMPAQKAAPKPGPSVAVLNEVKVNPGQSMATIVNGALAKGVKSSARDPKHMLRNTVDMLVKAGRLARLDGKLYPATEIRDIQPQA